MVIKSKFRKLVRANDALDASIAKSQQRNPEQWKNTVATGDRGGEHVTDAAHIHWVKMMGLKFSVVELPKADPYKEIYLEKEAFYRLVNLAWLDPGQVEDDLFNNDEKSWEGFEQHLKTAQQFHANLGTQTHPQTYQFYSEGLNTADRIVFNRHAYD